MNIQKVMGLVSKSVDMICWGVSVGGATLPSFSIDLGEKVKLRKRVRSSSNLKDLKFRGEASFLVWCAWRLDSKSAPIVSSDDEEGFIKEGLNQLVGKRLEKIEVTEPALDCALHFSDALVMRIFCEHTDKSPSFDGNWEAIYKDKAVYIGPGNKVEVEDFPY